MSTEVGNQNDKQVVSAMKAWNKMKKYTTAHKVELAYGLATLYGNQEAMPKLRPAISRK